MIGGQIAVLRRIADGEGVIIDMHAGDGNGVEIAAGQLDMFRPNVSDATPALAIRFANEGWPAAKVFLCESNFKKRNKLRTIYGSDAEILRTNRELLKVDYSRFGWAIVLNDPCGPAHHALDVMQHISASVEKSDFIIVINFGALGRLAGVRPFGDNLDEDAKVLGCRAKASEFAWMTDIDEWRSRLGKRNFAEAKVKVNNRAMKGKVVLLTNYICDGLRQHSYIRSDGK